ncbi:MAG: hypothetical protein J0J01_27440 [Reyranella sp.]|nr:hypothetical protein [Reyranella sp.]
MAERFPGLKHPLDEHIEANDEILPHVFFYDVTLYVLALAASVRLGSKPAERELRAILDLFEERFTNGSEDVQELISASFLENVPMPGEKGAEIREMVGPNMRVRLDLIG